jgi:hypothetical protein
MVVSEILGHASVSIALDIHRHVLPDIQHDVAEAMVQILMDGHRVTRIPVKNCCQKGSETEKRLQAQPLEAASIQPL